MKRTIKNTILLAAAAMLLIPTAARADGDKYLYYNPVEKQALPDPTVIRAQDGHFYLFATENIRNTPIYRSDDLVSWEFVGTAFTDETRPHLVEGGRIWAPDINYINGKYVLYYCMSLWGGISNNGIGVAVSDRPEGPYTDLGAIILAEETGVQNSIDQFYWEEEDGSKWMFWGSFRGIYAIRLSDDGLSVMPGAQKHRVAGSLTEGTCVYKRGGYYYLIGSAGSCCAGEKSTYHLVVARSENLLGPYVDKDGLPALGNHYSELLHRNVPVIGPGHCSEVIEDDAGQTWLLYHGFQAADVQAARVLYLDQVLWDSEGWPYMTGERPSDAWDRPVFSDPAEFTYSYVDYVEYKGGSAAKYLYDTGYVPKENTRIDVRCRTYPRSETGEPTDNQWRMLLSSGTSKSEGYGLSVYYSSDFPELSGTKWGYFGGGYIHETMAPHAYDTDCEISLSREGMTVDGKFYAGDTSAYTETHARLTLFSGFMGTNYCGRIYSVKVYEGDSLVHDYRPCIREEDRVPLFYDEVDGVYIHPSDPRAFSCGVVTK